jgi:parvulin-like peptidyl-prolyl isomerase
LQRINAGADFATLASTESDDTGSAQNGGDLGWFDRGDMVPAFEEAALRLKPGETSGIVRSPFGYHIIKLEDHEFESFDHVKSAIEERLLAETVKKRLESLQNGVKVEYNSAFFESGKR